MSKKKRVGDGVDGMDMLVCRAPEATKRYEISETLEAGMILQGSEVKSLRLRRADLNGAFASIDRDELWLHKMHIALYEFGGPHYNHVPRRSRKLLVKRREIEKLRGRLTTKGYTLVPLQVYFKGGYAKVQLGLGKGRKLHDDREELKQQQELREAREATRRR